MYMANYNPIPPPSNTGKEYQKTRKANPKAMLFATLYLTPGSKSFMNIYQSGVASGYSEQYSSNISSQRPKWWVELTETADFRRANMLDAAESALQDSVTSKSEDKEDKKIKHDSAKFISERLGKAYYSTRTEVTDADGRRLFDNKARDNANMPLETLFKGVSNT